MSPQTARQIIEALRNHRRPPRTHAARVRDALAHAMDSQMNEPGAVTSSNRARGTSVDANDNEQYNR